MYIHSTDIRTRVKCLIHNANTNPGFYIWSLLLCKCLQCSKADVKIKPYAYLKISKNTTSWKNMFWIFENGFFDAITQISLFYFWDIIWANIKMFHTLNLIFVPSQNQAILHALLINCNKHKGVLKTSQPNQEKILHALLVLGHKYEGMLKHSQPEQERNEWHEHILHVFLVTGHKYKRVTEKFSA